MRLPEEARFRTLLQHFGEEEKPHGAVVPPIYQSSLFGLEDSGELSELLLGPLTPDVPYVYSRAANPTNAVVERKLAMLEGTESARVMGSGMAAITAAVMSCVHEGAHVVCVETCYGPTYRLLTQMLNRFGVTASFVDSRRTDLLLEAIRPNTKLIYLESPTTAVFRLQDIPTITAEARSRGIATICDNSYGTPILQSPVELGVDIVVHSASKYLSGHSDITAGVICASKERLDRMSLPEGEIQILGGTLGPFQAFLLLRGLRTLELRVRAHEAAANQVASWLAGRNEVERVHHVGLPDHPQRELFLKQMRGSGGLLSFEPKIQDRDRVIQFVNALKLFQRGVSWGGFESLAIPLWVNAQDYTRLVVRLYCGLEDPQDLVEDLEQAFSQALA